MSGTTIAIIALVSIVVLCGLFWLVLNALGKSTFDEPQRLKVEILKAHGESPESRGERADDAEAWFGFIPKPSKASAKLWLIAFGSLVGIALIWIYWSSIMAFFHRPILNWLIPCAAAALGLIAIGILTKKLVDKESSMRHLEAVGIIGLVASVVLAAILWNEGMPLTAGTQGEAPRAPVEAMIDDTYATATEAGSAWLLTPPPEPAGSAYKNIVCSSPRMGPDTFFVRINHTDTVLTPQNVETADVKSEQFIAAHGQLAIHLQKRRVLINDDSAHYCD